MEVARFIYFLRAPLPLNQCKILKHYSSFTFCQNKNISEGATKNKLYYINVFDLKCMHTDKLLSNKNLDSIKNGLIVTIIGGGYTTIGATILLKQNPAIEEIRLVDTGASFYGSTYDTQLTDTSTIVKYFHKENILDGLENANIVAVMDENHHRLKNCEPMAQFALSASYVKKVTESIVSACPFALIAVFARPVTATVPLITEIFKCYGLWDPKKIIGSVAVESMQISAMVGSYLNLNPSCLSISIAGGVDSSTVTPLLSTTKPFYNFSSDEKEMLTEQLRSVDKNLIENESQVPILSHSAAVAKFLSTLINGHHGHDISVANAYVRSNILPSCTYMTTKLKFGPNGVKQNLGLPKMSKYEIHSVEQVIPIMNKMINLACEFVKTGRTN